MRTKNEELLLRSGLHASVARLDHFSASTTNRPLYTFRHKIKHHLIYYPKNFHQLSCFKNVQNFIHENFYVYGILPLCLLTNWQGLLGIGTAVALQLHRCYIFKCFTAKYNLSIYKVYNSCEFIQPPLIHIAGLCNTINCMYALHANIYAIAFEILIVITLYYVY